MASASSSSSPFQVLSAPVAGPSSASTASSLRPASHYVHLSGHGRSPEYDDDDDLQGNAIDYSDGTHIATPGQALGTLATYMRGHGTHLSNAGPKETAKSSAAVISSSLTGRVVLTNRLLSLQPFYTRYAPETGDLVLGQVVSVLPGARRWKIDLASSSLANLALSSINLPGGIQRRKIASDELQMRTFFKEGDWLVAEVQGVYNDGTVSLHTRSLRYGKLRNGRLVKVPARLVRRGKSHFVRLQQGEEVVEMILGLNGHIWLSAVGAMQSGSGNDNGSKGGDSASSSATPQQQDEQGIGGRGSGRDVDAGGTYSDDLRLPPSHTLSSLRLLSVLLMLLSNAYLPVSDQSVQLAWDVAAARRQHTESRANSKTEAETDEWWEQTMAEIKKLMRVRGMLGRRHGHGADGIGGNDGAYRGSYEDDEDAAMDEL